MGGAINFFGRGKYIWTLSNGAAEEPTFLPDYYASLTIALFTFHVALS